MTTIIKRIALFVAGAAVLCSCEGFIPDTVIDLKDTEKMAAVDYDSLSKLGHNIYEFLPDGFDRNGYRAMLAAACDEADFALQNSPIENLQKGAWSAVNNPYDIWDNTYIGIKRGLRFLQHESDYKDILLRDTSSTAGLTTYNTNCKYIKCLLAENKVMIALLYFELLKRYGGVPIVKEILGFDSVADLKRSTTDEVFDHCIKLIDEAYPDLNVCWYADVANEHGRICKAGALALKSRILLYAASPLYNPTNDIEKWKKAAEVTHQFYAANLERPSAYRHVLQADYHGSMLSTNGVRKWEFILYSSVIDEVDGTSAKSYQIELLNYPISQKGKVGHCPSENLVEAYEFNNGTPFSWDKVPEGGNPYANRDSRLYWSIYYNGNGSDTGHKFDCSDTGVDGPSVKGSSTTGYYLKKFVYYNDNLSNPTSYVHAWPIIRYAEILMNYAEAMNEAYGPDADPFGDGYTCRWAINQVRKRANQPNVVATTQAEMREKIRQEDRVEFAFEEHRIWDCRRWGLETAREALGSPLNGIKITHNADGTLKYDVFKVEDRVFKDHMIYYPIKQDEIMKSNGMIEQNPGW